MKFRCRVSAEYVIPDDQLRAVIDKFKEDWKGEQVELFPHDLINTAKDMGVGELSIENDIECDEPPLQESDAPEPRARRGKKGAR